MRTIPTLRERARRLGFTLIEMIGVLAIIAILVAAVAPRIFDAIADSKITAASTSIKALQSGVARYYADVGTLYPLSAVGVAAADAAIGKSSVPPAYAATLPDALAQSTSLAPASTGTGLWRKFRGPYTDAFTTDNPPIGTAMSLFSVAAVAGPATNLNLNFSLGNNATSVFPVGAQLVYLLFTGVSQKEWEKIDGMLDEGIGGTPLTKQAWGKVKWNSATGNLMVYVAHK